MIRMLARLCVVIAVLAQAATLAMAREAHASQPGLASLFCAEPGRGLSAAALQQSQTLTALLGEQNPQEPTETGQCGLCLLVGAALPPAIAPLPAMAVLAATIPVPLAHHDGPAPARGPPLGATGPPAFSTP